MILVSTISGWEAKRNAVRDYLNCGRMAPFTPAEVGFVDGTVVTAMQPRLATLIEPLPADENGNYPPDTEVLVVDILGAPTSIGWSHLDFVESISLKP